MHIPARQLQVAGLLAATQIAAMLPAQWPSGSSPNLAVADGAGEQVLPKVASTSDGGCYIGWFDNRTGSYAVRLQHLDAAGTELWGHNGIVVSANPQSSSLVDWDLICDRDDHCVIAFTDTRAGGDLDIYAYRITPAGAFAWGGNGVALSNNADYEPNPRIAEATDGDFVFVWANTVARTVQMQRLDRQGVPRFPGDGLAFPGETGATPGFCRVVAADNGAVVVSWVRTTAFTGNKHVHAQKYDAAGQPVWNAGQRVAVFDAGSVPIAHDPRLIPDGQGGAVLAWHFAPTAQFSVRVQHLLQNGTEAFPHNGVDPSTSANSRFDPAIAFRAASQETFVVWNERNVAQTTWGIFAQKLDAAGAPAFGATGLQVLPINTVTKFAPVAVPFGDGILGFVLEESLGGLADQVTGFRVDGAGTLAWTPATVAVSNVPSDKLRLTAAITPSGGALVAWTDPRNGTPDLYAQKINANATLGAWLGDVTAYGCGVNPAGSMTTTGRPALGTSMTIALHNPIGTQAIGSLPILALAAGADAAYPCGSPRPSFSMAGPAGTGELLIDLLQPVAPQFAGPWLGQPVPFPVGVPLAPALAGAMLFAQGVLLDPTPNALAPIGLTTAVRLVAGF